MAKKKELKTVLGDLHRPLSLSLSLSVLSSFALPCNAIWKHNLVSLPRRRNCWSARYFLALVTELHSKCIRMNRIEKKGVIWCNHSFPQTWFPREERSVLFREVGRSVDVVINSDCWSGTWNRVPTVVLIQSISIAIALVILAED